MVVLTSATFLIFLFFPFTVGALVFVLALVDFFPLGFSSSESDVAISLLCNSFSLVARLEDGIVAPPLDVDAAAPVCPSSTKLMSSGETWAFAPTDQMGCLKIWIAEPSKKKNCEHLIHWKAQRIGVMKTKVAASSPSSSTVVSREASNRLMTPYSNYAHFVGFGDIDKFGNI